MRRDGEGRKEGIAYLESLLEVDHLLHLSLYLIHPSFGF
jgi:hypothetical protein